jgi:RNA polymerase-interacting CarD/CdnL/TRCF family regulator
MTASEASELLENINSGEILWIDNDAMRRDLYQSILTEGQPEKLASLFRTLVLRKRTLEECSRKLRSTDETCMRSAEKLIARECSYASGESQDELIRRLNDMIEGPRV